MLNTKSEIIQIRRANETDLEALLDIYNYEVLHGVATLDLHPKNLDQWKTWYSLHNVGNHPLIVAVINETVAGYASLSSYREKEAYCSTVELSIYVAPAFRKKGIATQLMSNILEIAKQDESIHLVVSVITGGNQASERLHDKFGFRNSGTIHEVGYKMGRYLDIVNYELKV